MEPEQSYSALRALGEAANTPIIVTPKAKGSLPDDHPLSAGTIGLTRADPIYEILDEADCIMAVGFDVVELVKPWDQQAPLIWIAPWPNNDPPVPAVAEFVGPMHAAGFSAPVGCELQHVFRVGTSTSRGAASQT
jgi:thiamine pyrophosphate-dependent acetolactate synthase large subunit-like protein